MSYCVSVTMSSEGKYLDFFGCHDSSLPFQTMKVEFVTIYFLLHDFLAVNRILYFYEKRRLSPYGKYIRLHVCFTVFWLNFEYFRLFVLEKLLIYIHNSKEMRNLLTRFRIVLGCGEIDVWAAVTHLHPHFHPFSTVSSPYYNKSQLS